MTPAHALTSFAAVAIFAIGLTPAVAGSGAKEIAVVPAAEEECLSYEFLDLQYIHTSFDSLDDGHGAGVNLSKGLAGNVYFTGSADWSSSSIDHADVDLYGATAGLGYAIPVSRRFHLNIEAGGIYGQFDGPYGYNDEKWGGYVGPGFRYCLSPGMEVFANVYYVLCEGGEDLFETNVGVVANITETVAFKVAGLLGEDDQSVMAGLRFYY